MKYTIHLISKHGNVEVREVVQNDSLPAVVQLGHAMIGTYCVYCKPDEDMTLSIYYTDTTELVWKEHVDAEQTGTFRDESGVNGVKPGLTVKGWA